VNELITEALKRAFKKLDDAYNKEFNETSNKCGAAAVIVLIVGNRLFCANVGDSRAVLCRNGKAINLSLDQKAVN
jgi:protein phosphatase 1L